MANNVKAELIALMQGLKIALARGLLPLEVNVDCRELIDFIENDHPSYTNMLSDCRDRLTHLGSPPVHHTFREANRVVDALAKKGLQINQENSVFCLEVPPVFVSEKLDADKGGTLFARLQTSNSTSTNCNSYNDIVSSQNYSSRLTALPLSCNDTY
ncbi:hypothetical protein MTR67_045169 [Solanum verrucosum]|uniref:RNase H type-1 domain-containing protein n=1 Tax=Solanum verrucosum TaxID=315347 RepID=A0AAF0ZWR3_SOLVR|nr:hypothetical protein MTR67_045169 [Solanum verrucosum]